MLQKKCMSWYKGLKGVAAIERTSLVLVMDCFAALERTSLVLVMDCFAALAMTAYLSNICFGC
jgi:hypothetical protein